MLKRAAIFGGAAFLSGVFLAASGATRLGIPEGTWPYVWPALVAAVLLILAIVAVVVGWRRGSLPLWLAFLAQTVGSVAQHIGERAGEHPHLPVKGGETPD